MNQTDEAKRKRNRYIPDDFEIDPDFKRPVSYNTTGVHIPTDIFEGCKFTQTRRFCKYISSSQLLCPVSTVLHSLDSIYTKAGPFWSKYSPDANKLMASTVSLPACGHQLLLSFFTANLLLTSRDSYVECQRRRS